MLETLTTVLRKEIWNKQWRLSCHFVKVIKDRETGKSKGFAFVEMENDAEAAQAMNELNGSEFMDANW